MEAIIAILKNLLKNTVVAIVVGAVLGLILGLLVGWVAWPVEWTDGTPEVLREDLQNDYLRMAVESYRVNKAVNPQAATDQAEDRWEALGEAGPATLGRVQADPSVDPASVQDYRAAIESRKGPIAVPVGGEPAAASSSWLIYAAVAVILVVAGAGGFYLFRLLRKNTGPVTAVMHGAEISRQV
jgi:hypothetical protein